MPALHYYPSPALSSKLRIVSLPMWSDVNRFSIPVGTDTTSRTGKTISNRVEPDERVRISLVENIDHTDALGRNTYQLLRTFMSHIRQGANGLFMASADVSTAWAGWAGSAPSQGTNSNAVTLAYNWMAGSPVVGESIVLDDLGRLSPAFSDELEIQAIGGGGLALTYNEEVNYNHTGPTLVRESGTHLGLYLKAEDLDESALTTIHHGNAFSFSILARVNRHALRAHQDHGDAFADNNGVGGSATFESVVANYTP